MLGRDFFTQIVLAPRRSLRQRAPVRYNQDELLQQEQPGPLASIPKDDDDDFNAEDEVYLKFYRYIILLIHES